MSKEDYFKPADVVGHAEFDRIWGDPTYKPEIPRTMKAISKHLGKHEQTCYGWKKAFRGNGGYNSDEYLETQNKTVDEALIKACEKGSPQALMTYFKRTGKIVEKREDTLTVVSTADRIRIARELRDGLRREWEDAGSCPICFQSKALRHEVCVDTESEYGENREVATLGLPT